ncbi:Signal transduction histidine kinase [Streptomyces sp. WMMB 714]|nr:Signal transduction histidine kinase [Streptomyces sp. WMMB 714]
MAADDSVPDLAPQPLPGSAPDSGPRADDSRGMRLVCEVRRWMRVHPFAVDTALALAAFLAIVAAAAATPHGPEIRPRLGERDVEPLTVLLAALACGALTLRRRAPLPVLGAATLATVLGMITDPPADVAPHGHRAPIVVAAIIALYTVADRTDRVTGVRAGAATVVVLTASGMLLGGRAWYAQENFGIFAWTALAAAAGEAMRSRRAFVDAIRERAERAERTREEEALRRVAEERMRIARELHDVVAHHIALVNVQAGVASHVMDQRPDQAKEALAHVREASRHALDELQATVGLLRQSGESPAPTEPAPGLGVLDELVEGFTRAGLAVSVSVTGARPEAGAAPDLPSALDLTAYRVVQEALTNVQKHVGTGAQAEVAIDIAPSLLEITVTDDGAAPGPGGLPAGVASGGESGAGGGGGHGLIGMRERVAALHGSCETGPLRDGGFRVRVRLPLPPAHQRDTRGAQEARSAPPRRSPDVPHPARRNQAAAHPQEGTPT